MADQYINPTGLQAIKEWAKSKFTNKIEKIKVNGVEEIITNKEVDISTPSLSIDTSDAKVSDRSDNSFTLGVVADGVEYTLRNDNTVIEQTTLASKDYVDSNGGKIDEIYINAIKQPITNKKAYLRVDTIDISQADEKVTWEYVGEEYTYDASLGNSTNGTTFEVAGTQTELVSKTYVDATFRTEAQVQQAIDDSLADVTNWKFSEPMLTLPATGEIGTIYLVARGNVLEPPYDEWFWLVPKTGDPHFEKFGDTTIDLSTYWTMTDGKANSLVAMTVAEINEILNA